MRFLFSKFLKVKISYTKSLTFKNGIIRNLVNCINVQITFVYKAYFDDLVVLTFSFTFADEI